jgi:molybdopterin/thiamine biosynthesis adenylyltransferase
VLPGVIGLLQATEALKLILGLGDSLAGRLLHFDALSMRFRETRLGADPDCPACAPGRVFTGYRELQAICGY